MKKHNKWLLRKVARSKDEYWYRPKYGDERCQKKGDPDNLPFREPVKKRNFSGLDTTLVKRWLYHQVGNHFDEVYAAFLPRIQPKYLDEYRDCIYRYLFKAEEIMITEEGLPQRRFTQQYNTSRALHKSFYIHPDTKILCRTPKEARFGDYKRRFHPGLGTLYRLPNAEFWKGKYDKPYAFELRIKVLEDLPPEETLDQFYRSIANIEQLKKIAIKAIKDFAKYFGPKSEGDNYDWTIIQIRLETASPKQLTLILAGGIAGKCWHIKFEGTKLMDLFLGKNED